ncbi:hypothetical protein CEXT_529941 [Caerostris extrusa]|uniref:Secreted protein n=1 Tax=Caerostris extrusa TaxID=172846 RepID=A0AAV4VAB4_CAEEX|nr:hypothetical protein CEXT_529941 [Caerostris extrusa]
MFIFESTAGCVCLALINVKKTSAMVAVLIVCDAADIASTMMTCRSENYSSSRLKVIAVAVRSVGVAGERLATTKPPKCACRRSFLHQA